MARQQFVSQVKVLFVYIIFFIVMTRFSHNSAKAISHFSLAVSFFVFLFCSWSVSSSDIRNRLGRTQLTGTRLADSCPEKKQHICQPQKFRHASSLCNNVQNPTWGTADTTYGRLQPASYSDGKSHKSKLKHSTTFLIFK